MLIGYARVSTRDQNLDHQIDALIKAGCERSHIFTDKVSGAKSSRPGLDQALSHLRAGDTLVVYKLDRLGRSVPHLVETVTSLQQRGIEFKSLTEQIDTSTSGGKLVFHTMAAVAEFIRDSIRERTHAGLQAARARGKTGGTGVRGTGRGMGTRRDVGRRLRTRRRARAEGGAFRVNDFGPLQELAERYVNDAAFRARMDRDPKGTAGRFGVSLGGEPREQHCRILPTVKACSNQSFYQWESKSC